MNIIKEVILNQLIRIPAVKARAKKSHQTGLSHNPELLAQSYARIVEYSPVKNKDVLELGPGKTIEIIQRALVDGASSVAIADVEAYLDSRQISDNKINYVVYNGRTVPLPDESFDLIWSHDVYEHLRFPKITVEETYRLLRPGGMVVHMIDLMDHFAFGKEDLNLAFNCLKYPEWLWELMTWNRSNYVNRLRASEWIALHQSAGFKILINDTESNKHIMENYKSEAKLKYLLRYSEYDAISAQIFIVAIK